MPVTYSLLTALNGSQGLPTSPSGGTWSYSGSGVSPGPIQVDCGSGFITIPFFTPGQIICPGQSNPIVIFPDNCFQYEFTYDISAGPCDAGGDPILTVNIRQKPTLDIICAMTKCRYGIQYEATGVVVPNCSDTVTVNGRARWVSQPCTGCAHPGGCPSGAWTDIKTIGGKTRNSTASPAVGSANAIQVNGCGYILGLTVQLSQSPFSLYVNLTPSGPCASDPLYFYTAATLPATIAAIRQTIVNALLPNYIDGTNYELTVTATAITSNKTTVTIRFSNKNVGNPATCKWAGLADNEVFQFKYSSGAPTLGSSLAATNFITDIGSPPVWVTTCAVPGCSILAGFCGIGGNNFGSSGLANVVNLGSTNWNVIVTNPIGGITWTSDGHLPITQQKYSLSTTHNCTTNPTNFNWVGAVVDPMDPSKATLCTNEGAITSVQASITCPDVAGFDCKEGCTKCVIKSLGPTGCNGQTNC